MQTDAFPIPVTAGAGRGATEITMGYVRFSQTRGDGRPAVFTIDTVDVY